MKFDAKHIIKETEDESDREEYTMKNIHEKYSNALYRESIATTGRNLI